MGIGGIIALIVVAVILIVIIGWAISFYNGVRTLDNNVENGFAQIDVQLKRRNDLIPNLVETIKGYTKHESQTLTAVIEARNKMISSSTTGEKVAAGNELSGALSRLSVVVEQYPQLKADTGFLSLQKDLTETENKISHMRQFYNDGVLIYNRRISTFPNLLLAKLFKFLKKEYLQTPEYERQNVSVKF